MELRDNSEAKYTGVSPGRGVGDAGERNATMTTGFMLIKQHGGQFH